MVVRQEGCCVDVEGIDIVVVVVDVADAASPLLGLSAFAGPSRLIGTQADGYPKGPCIRVAHIHPRQSR